jgi:hypothetical protein
MGKIARAPSLRGLTEKEETKELARRASIALVKIELYFATRGVRKAARARRCKSL